MPEADRTTPQTIKKKIRRRKKPARAYSPPRNFRTEAPTRRSTPKAGPPSPQRTGRPVTRQPVARKRSAPPTTTDRTSDARRTPAQKARDRAAVNTNVREARRKVIAKRQRSAVVNDVKAELEGRGVFAKGLSSAAGFVEKHAIVPSTGAGPSGVRLVQKPRKGSMIATATAPPPVKIKGTVAGNVAKDLINLPANALPAVYVPVAGGFEAARGRPQRIKQFGKDLDQHDPVVNLAAAGVEAVRGNTGKAKARLRRAEKAAEEHPGFALAEAVGVKGALGRGGGAVGRSGVLGAGAKRAASTDRAARQVPATEIREQRSYSKDVITKGRQVAVDTAKRRHARRLREKARSAAPDRAVELRERAAKVDPARLPEKEIARRVDERVAVNEDVRRAHRAGTVSGARKIVSAAKREGAATSVVAQRIARADRTDLAAYVRELEGQFDGLSNSGKRANRVLRRELQRVIDDPKADMGKVEEAARAYEKLTAPLQRKLVKREILNEEQAQRAKVIPYAVRHMDAESVVEWADGQKFPNRRIMQRDPEGFRKWERLKKEVEDARLDYHAAKGEPDGDVQAALERLNDAKEKAAAAKVGAHRELSTEDIRAHMQTAKVGEPAFVTQRPNQRGAKNFNIRSERPPGIPSGRRTGEATRKGTFDADPETLVEGAARMRGLVDATDGFRKTIKEFAARGSDGKVIREKSYARAFKRAEDLMHDENGEPIAGAVKMRPVLLNPFKGSKEQLENLLDEVDSLDQNQASAITDALRGALSAKSGPGPWALIPEAAAKRLQEHLNTQGGGGGIKTLQLLNQSFRRTVLATSPSWVSGNFIEGLGRAALAKAGPGSYRHGRNVLHELERIDPKKAEEAAHRIVGGGHFSSADRLHMRRGAEQFEGTRLAPVATALGKFWRTPGPKQAAELWNRWTDFMFQTVNSRFETKVQTAMFGRALKDAGLKAHQDAARGLTNTEAQVEFGRQVDRMYGQYAKFSPAKRQLIASYTPFVAWFINSWYFVFRTLPRDHPVVTGLTASAVNATDEWRKNEGLDLFIKGALPGFLQGSIPTGGGAHQRISRYTPLGAFGDPTETAASQVLPLMSGVLAAFKGQDWKGKELRVKGPDGKSRPADPIERAVFGAKAFLEATVPIYGVAKRVAEQGPKALDPFKDVAPKPGKPKKLRVAKPGAGTGSRIRRSTPSSGGGLFDSGGSSSSSGGGLFSP